MFIRFVIGERDEDSQVDAGVFVAAYRLKEKGHLVDHEHEELTDLLKWFDENLEKPKRFTRSKYPRAKPKAISWVKSSAKEHVSKMWDLVRILENNSITVRVIKAKRPGYIVFEDEFQVAAEPFSDLDV